MAIRAVIDTNIWISALLNPYGYPAKLRKAFEKGLFEIVISEPILEEIADVLSRPRLKKKYGLAEIDIHELLLLIEERAEHVLIVGDVSVCRDKDDDFIIETAIKGKAACLVTRDDDLKADIEVKNFLSQFDISILSVSKFLNIIDKNSL